MTSPTKLALLTMQQSTSHWLTYVLFSWHEIDNERAGRRLWCSSEPICCSMCTMRTLLLCVALCLWLRTLCVVSNSICKCSETDKVDDDAFHRRFGARYCIRLAWVLIDIWFDYSLISVIEFNLNYLFNYLTHFIRIWLFFYYNKIIIKLQNQIIIK